MSQDHKRRVAESLTETMKLIDKYTNRKTYDASQESERQARLSQYESHRDYLLGLLA